MRYLLLFLLLGVATPTARAATDTVYVAHGARRTPRVEWRDERGARHRLRPRRMRRDTLTVGDRCFVRLPRLDLFLCIGQSNMAGRGELDAAAREVLDGVYLFDGDRACRASEPLNRYSTIRKELGMQGVGPAGSFARRYAEATGRPVGLVVNARGGSSVGEWQPGAPAGYLAEALCRIGSVRRWGEVRAVLWHQGEADTRHPERYPEAFGRVVAALREELGDPELPVIFGEIASWNWTGRAEGTAPFNAMLGGLALPRTACVSSEGLPPLRGEDDPHFSAAGQRELGRRYAEALLRLLNEPTKNR